ncbi:MAG: hypothetical protein KA436_06995 [Oligoflexales bacterium]|nr:hypothetical protein [Oligoflexales bacterium]
MVNCLKTSKLIFITLLASLLVSTQGFALLPQTANDLERLKDFLRTRVMEDEVLRAKTLPMLVASPVHHWEESREDFADAVFRMIDEILPPENTNESKKVILCLECDQHRVNVSPGGSTIINNGPLSLSEIAELKKLSSTYQEAKSLALIKETPAGMSMRIISLTTGEILFFSLADSTQTLKDIEPSLNYAREYERRKRGEPIIHSRFNFGFFPSMLVQLEFLEQWGDLNQHITGIGFSFAGPEAAIGLTYKFLPAFVDRNIDFGCGLYYSMSGLVSSSGSKTSAINFQGIATYTWGNRHGVFAAATLGQESSFSIGLSFYNPVMLPFLL